MARVPDFDALYRDDPDPWRVGTSFYEQRKLDIVLASLTQASYRVAWDPACGTGELAARLAARAAAVVATDASAEAVRLTAARCAELPAVTVGPLRQPAAAGAPDLGFDLIVVAEFAYYLPPPDRSSMWDVLTASTAHDADLAVVHWRHRPHDAHLSGADVNLELAARLTADPRGWSSAVHHEDRDFVLDIFRRGDR